MRDSLTLQAPAKINLFLKVLRRRADGYHDIYSLLQMVSLYDDLEMSRIEQGIELEVVGADLAADESNLVWRAAALIKERTEFPGGLRIRLTKRIPIGAGLGGGSSDAAAILLAIREMFDLRIGDPELSGWASELGSDVPFFLSSGQAIISGRGEIVEEVELPTDYQVVLIAPNFSVSTAWAYEQLKIPLTRDSTPPSFKIGTRRQGFYRQLQQIGNDFESVVATEFPAIRVQLDGLRRAGAGYAALSGSGSALFGLFAGDLTPDALATMKTSPDARLFVVRPVCR
ncbi:MAG: 4-(cytidine 5'-diphospho)-2-C-methyl-D-erythritol kinase [bacterium]